MAARTQAIHLTKTGLFRAAFVALLPILAGISPSAAQCVMACQQSVQVSLDATGQTVVTPAIVAPYSALNCGGTFTLTVFDTQQQPIPNNTLDCSRLNQTLNVRVVHDDTGNLCWGSVIPKDYLPPALACTQKFIACNADTTAQLVGFPTVSDNCTPLTTANLKWSNQKTDLPCTTVVSGQTVTARIDRTFSAKDAAGNTASCVQKIYLRRATLADVAFPPNRDDFAAPALACGQSPNDLSLTGQPTVDGKPVSAVGDCELLISFADQTVPGCSPASVRVLRSWTVSDFCANTFTIHVQVIKVDDKTPPTLAVPASITVGTGTQSCSATVNLPQATATDACSSVTISASTPWGSGYGPFAGAVPGNHAITYTATDACGNSATATMTVSVRDDKSPTAVCKNSAVLNLPSAGTATLNASALDNGSNDNCQLAPFEASRDGGATFAGQLVFTCADVSAPVPIILKVTDAQDLENTCNSEVKVRDNLKPSIQCPANKTLTCQNADVSPAATGSALTTDNCGSATMTFSDISNLNTCNVGNVVRTWRATDAQGNTDACTQTITLTAVAGSLSVQFPADKMLTACATASATDPSATGQPTISGQSCLPPSVTFSDEKIAPAPPACFNILRKWKVIDWCVYNPNGGTAGIWEHTQIIRVHDLAPPIFAPMPNLTVAATLPGCFGQATLSDAMATDCSAPTVSNNSAYAIAHAGNASGIYPVGNHVVTFTATDACGLSSTMSVRVLVFDQTPPTAICNDNAVVNIPAAGTIAVPAAQLAAGSTDNCTAAANLTFSASPPSVTCAQIGPRQITVTVGDASGNTAICTATLTVSDGLSNCGGGEFEVGGAVRTAANVPVPNIPVSIAGDDFAATEACSTAGDFAFPDLPAGKNYRLQPENRNKWMNGVSTFDLLLISKHLLGVQLLDSPYKIIAADANKSGTVTSFDILQLRKMILGIIDTLPGNSSWRFVPAAFAFAEPNNPFATPFPEEIQLAELSANQPNQDFIAIKVGDLNLSANAADARSPRDTVFLHLENGALEAGKTTALPLKIADWSLLEGLQFEILLDTARAKLLGWELPPSKNLRAEHLASSLDGGRIAVSWDNAGAKPTTGDSLLLTLLVQPKTSARTDNLLKTNAERLAPEAYPAGRERAAVAFRFDGASAATEPNLSLLGCRPNPFRAATTISFALPIAAEVSLRVSDATGRVVMQKNTSCAAGLNELTLLRNELPSAGGLYFFQLKTQGAPSVCGRMVAISGE